MKIHKRKIIISLGSSFTIPMGFALENECSSARFMAMGGAGVSIAEPSLEALCYNPAGLAQSRNLVNEIILLSPLVMLTSDAQSIAGDISTTPKPVQMIQKYSEKPQHVSFQNVTGIFLKRAALSIYQKAQGDVLLGTSPITGTPQASAEAKGWAGIGLTFACSLWEKGGAGLFLGTHFKFQQKAEAKAEVGIKDMEAVKQNKNHFKQLIKRGNGIGGDVGMLWNFGGRSSPKVGLVAKNLGMVYRWPVKPNKIAPQREPTTLNLGVSMEPETKKSRMVLALDVNDIFNKTESIIFKRLHLGAMLSFLDVVGVMGGLNQGYPTYGAFLSLKFLRVEGGLTSEELGKLPGERQSKRLFARISLGWLQ